MGMLGQDYTGQNCSIARALEVLGERWTLLILRDSFHGVARFDDFHRRLGLARSVLTARLQRLCDHGVLERRLYQERPDRYEYRLTEMGRELFPVLVGLRRWGDRHLAPAGPPLTMHHVDCGGEATAHVVCDGCGADLGAADVHPRIGPGLQAGHLA